MSALQQARESAEAARISLRCGADPLVVLNDVLGALDALIKEVSDQGIHTPRIIGGPNGLTGSIISDPVTTPDPAPKLSGGAQPYDVPLPGL